jgi:hypothetical protein
LKPPRRAYCLNLVHAINVSMVVQIAVLNNAG